MTADVVPVGALLAHGGALGLAGEIAAGVVGLAAFVALAWVGGRARSDDSEHDDPTPPGTDGPRS